MIGANGFDIDRFTTSEIDTLLAGLSVGDEFFWRGETVKVTSLIPFECHTLWDLEL